MNADAIIQLQWILGEQCEQTTLNTAMFTTKLQTESSEKSSQIISFRQLKNAESSKGKYRAKMRYQRFGIFGFASIGQNCIDSLDRSFH